MIETDKRWNDWTKAEDERLLQGRERGGVTFRELAEQLGRSQQAVQTRYYKLLREAALANGAAHSPAAEAPSPEPEPTAAEAPGPELRPPNPFSVEFNSLAGISELLMRLPPGARRRIIVWLRDWITEEEAGW